MTFREALEKIKLPVSVVIESQDDIFETSGCETVSLKDADGKVFYLGTLNPQVENGAYVIAALLNAAPDVCNLLDECALHLEYNNLRRDYIHKAGKRILAQLDAGVSDAK